MRLDRLMFWSYLEVVSLIERDEAFWSTQITLRPFFLFLEKLDGSSRVLTSLFLISFGTMRSE